MTLANTAFDLARYSQGRFVLGLGSQVKPHIERRFSMPWSHPAARMREFVAALRAIWASWQDGEKLDFRGDFYTHTLMTPFFSPSAHEWGAPPVYLAGVGKLMTEVAGEVCDGFFFHGFTTPSYLQRGHAAGVVARPGEGRAHRSRKAALDGFAIAGPAFTCVGRTEDELAAAIRGAKEQIAFYASTPAYRGVLEHHGWGDLQPELTRMSKEGKWKEMARRHRRRHRPHVRRGRRRRLPSRSSCASGGPWRRASRSTRRTAPTTRCASSCSKRFAELS